jgi:hypothetical protein
MNTNTQINLSECNVHLDNIIEQSLKHCFHYKLEEVLKGRRIIFCIGDKNIVPLEGWTNRRDPFCATTARTIQPTNEMSIISAIDSSSIQIAETEDGTIYAVKCGIAIAAARHTLVHFKIGPLLFYLSEETVKRSELDHRLARVILFDNDSARKLIRTRVERAIQAELAKHFTKSIILVDGALESSFFESYCQNINKIAESCSLYNNSLVGISKNTKLKVLDKISLPLKKMEGPAYMDVDLVIKSLIGNALGNNLLVRFGNNNCPILRLDVIPTVEDRDKVLAKLLGNDLVACGYPDSLRLAHHISLFSPIEISCIRGHILTNYGVIELTSEDIRKTLLGSLSV